MKPDSLKELQEAVAVLTYVKDNTVATNVEDAKEDIGRALNHLRSAIFMETPSGSTKFNLFDVADDDNGTRPVMGCVHHEGGYKVASDQKVLCAVKSDYPEDLEGKNIDRKGVVNDDRYPKWQLVFPKTKEGDGYEIDFEKVSQWRKEYATEKKINGKWGARKAYVKVGPAFFKLDLFAKMANFMKSQDTNVLYVGSSNRGATCYAENGSKGIIMPVRFAVIENRDCDIAECWERKDDRVMIWSA